MASIEELLKGNPYKDIFAPIIGAYNATQLNLPNPHEVWLAASIIEMRAQYWGTNMPEGEPSQLVDPSGGSGAGANHCCRKNPKTCSCKGAAAQGARADGSGAASPNTTRTQTLEQELRTIDMSQPNAWQDWSEAVAAFYNNIGPFLTYFDYKYKDGRYADFYNSALGVITRPGGYTKGLSINLAQEGVNDSATTTITLHKIGINEGQPNAYFIMWANNTDRYIVWWPSGGLAVPPAVPPMLGINDFYIQVNASFLNTAEQVQQLTIDAVNAIDLGTVFTAIPGQTINPGPDELREVIITLNAVAVNPPVSTFQLSTINTIFWSGTFAQESTSTIINFGFSLADLTLADRFFVLYDLAGNTYMFYYNLDGAGTFVPPFTPDALIPINIVTGDLMEDIQTATIIAVESQGIGSMNTLKDFPLVSEFIYDQTGPVTGPNEGTVMIGINYEFNDELVASDLSVLATGITSNEEYANAWNTLRVPYEETLGYTYPYLDSRIVSIGSSVQRTGGPCGACYRAVGTPVYCADADGSSNPDIQPVCCRDCNSAASSAAFRATPYDMFTNPTYNTPGNIFNASEGRQKNLISNDDIV